MDKALTVRELTEILMSMPQDEEVVVFTQGDNYPALQVQQVEGYVEIGGGWEPYCEGEDI